VSCAVRVRVREKIASRGASETIAMVENSRVTGKATGPRRTVLLGTFAFALVAYVLVRQKEGDASSLRFATILREREGWLQRRLRRFADGEIGVPCWRRWC